MIEAIFAAVGFIFIFFLAVTIVAAAVLSYLDDPDAPLERREDDAEQVEYIKEWMRKNRR